jgi:hypothetical protein
MICSDIDDDVFGLVDFVDVVVAVVVEAVAVVVNVVDASAFMFSSTAPLILCV